MTDEEAIRQYLAHMARRKDFHGIVEFATWTALLAQHRVLGCDCGPFAADARKHAMALLRMDLKAPHIGDMLYHARMCAFAAANAHYDPEGVRASQCDWLRVRHA